MNHCIFQLLYVNISYSDSIKNANSFEPILDNSWIVQYVIVQWYNPLST